MALLTLKPYLGGEKAEEAVRNAISALLDAGTKHAIQADAEEYESFRQDVARLLGKAGSGAELTLEQLLINVRTVAHAIESYNSRTSRIIRKQTSELRNMITMLTQAVVKIAGSSTRSGEALDNIKSHLESAAATEDIQGIRYRLGDCLNFVCEEFTRQKEAADSMMSDLKSQINNAQASVADNREFDRVTGLPLRQTAEAAFQEALSRGKHYILTLVLDRLQSINARFGSDVGDQVLRALRTHVETGLLAKGDRLFRWTGPALVVLMPRQQDLHQVRGAIRRFLDTVERGEFDIEGRTVLIPLSVAWSVIALIAPAENAPKYIERFVADQMPRDYI